MKLSRIFKTTTVICLATTFLILFVGTVLATATDITGILTTIPENTTAAGTAQASGGTGPYKYYLTCTSPGADDSNFNINIDSGVLTFKIAPNYEIPSDFDTNNIYEVCIKAVDNDDGNPYSTNFSISITNVVDDIVLTPRTSNTNKSIAYYGVTTGWMLSGADASHVDLSQGGSL